MKRDISATHGLRLAKRTNGAVLERRRQTMDGDGGTCQSLKQLHHLCALSFAL